MPKNAFSSDLLDIFHKGMNEILPADQINLLVREEPISGNFAFSIEKILVEAEKQYGILSASGLFFRSGSAAFKFLVRQHGKETKLDSLEFRLQPQQKRLMDGTHKLIKLLEEWQAGKFSFQTIDDLIEITVSAKELRSTEIGSRIWLHFIAGLFQEYLYWAGSGKQYPFQIITQNQPANEIVIQFRMIPVD